MLHRFIDAVLFVCFPLEDEYYEQQDTLDFGLSADYLRWQCFCAAPSLLSAREDDALCHGDAEEARLISPASRAVAIG